MATVGSLPSPFSTLRCSFTSRRALVTRLSETNFVVLLCPNPCTCIYNQAAARSLRLLLEQAAYLLYYYICSFFCSLHCLQHNILQHNIFSFSQAVPVFDEMDPDSRLFGASPAAAALSSGNPDSDPDHDHPDLSKPQAPVTVVVQPGGDTATTTTISCQVQLQCSSIPCFQNFLSCPLRFRLLSRLIYNRFHKRSFAKQTMSNSAFSSFKAHMRKKK